MILIADGGSTSVDWILIKGGKIKKEVYSAGVNPFIRGYDEIFEEISRFVAPKFKNSKIETIYFFGAGCATQEKNEIVKKAIAESFNIHDIRVDSDLMGAAIGLCKNSPGIVGILGTGSNSCFYDGKTITHHVPPLGYILGDEGSGAVLGKLFLNACLKNQLTEGIKEKFFDTYNLTVPDIMSRVYDKPMPNRFLGTIADFMIQNFEDDSIHDLVCSSFADFFRKNIMQYKYKQYMVHLTGSIAYIMEDTVRDIARELDIYIGSVLESPMVGLIDYYSSKK